MLRLSGPRNSGETSDVENVHLQKALSDRTIKKIMAEKCCRNKCIRGRLTKQEIVKSRKALQDLTEKDRSLILNLFQLSYFHPNGRRQYTFHLNEKDICRTAWLRAVFSDNVGDNIVDRNLATVDRTKTYSPLPITQTFKGNRKVRVLGVENK